MSAHGLHVLVQNLTHLDSVEVLAKEGLDPAVIPHEGVREVYRWVIDYYHQSGRVQAPSAEAIRATFGDRVDAEDIPLGQDPEDSVQFAMADLRTDYAMAQSEALQRQHIKNMFDAEAGTHAQIISSFASQLIALSGLLESKASLSDLRTGIDQRISAYEGRAQNSNRFDGLRLGWPEVDSYTFGIHSGELAVIAGATKSSKSFALAWSALAEWKANRPTVLYTLENSVEMTLDRMACLATGTNYRNWQRGQSDQKDIDDVRAFQKELADSNTPLWVYHPTRGKRSAEFMVRDAVMRGANSLLIDQLTFMEAPDYRRPRHEQIRDIVHALKSEISAEGLPCVLAHQINREGVASARKHGHYEMHHLADGAEVERTADWVFALFRSRDMEAVKRLMWQTLASRRETLRHFDFLWEIGVGNLKVIGEARIDD